SPIGDSSLYEPATGTRRDTSIAPLSSATYSACDAHCCPPPSVNSARMVACSFGARPLTFTTTASSIIAFGGVTSMVCAAAQNAIPQTIRILMPTPSLYDALKAGRSQQG